MAESRPKKIRVIRILEYIYPSTEEMIKDMERWYVKNILHAGTKPNKITIRSTSLSPEVLENKLSGLKAQVWEECIGCSRQNCHPEYEYCFDCAERVKQGKDPAFCYDYTKNDADPNKPYVICPLCSQHGFHLSNCSVMYMAPEIADAEQIPEEVRNWVGASSSK